MAPGLRGSPLMCLGQWFPQSMQVLFGSATHPSHSALPVDKTEGKRLARPESWLLFPSRGCQADVLHLMAADAQERTAALSTRGLFPGAGGLAAVGQKEWLKAN